MNHGMLTEVLFRKISTLTQREKEVLDHIFAGKTYKQIAIDLNITYPTEEFHRTNIMHKLPVNSIAELIKI